jgi:hypothetical protein
MENGPDSLATATHRDGPSGEDPERASLPLWENPVLTSEVRSLFRRWPVWLGITLLLWAPASWFLRFYLIRERIALTSLWQEFALGSLYYMIRPDMLLGFLLVYGSVATTRWHSRRQEVAVTFLTGTEVLIGKILPPAVLLVGLNLLASPFAYFGFAVDPEYFVRFADSRLIIPMGIFISLFAMVEDFLYAALVVAIALREYLLREDALLSTFRAAGQVILIGLGIHLFAWLPVLIPWQILTKVAPTLAQQDFVLNMLFFAVALPYEVFAFRLYYRSLRKRLPVWLAEERR